MVFTTRSQWFDGGSLFLTLWIVLWWISGTWSTQIPPCPVDRLQCVTAGWLIKRPRLFRLLHFQRQEMPKDLFCPLKPRLSFLAYADLSKVWPERARPGVKLIVKSAVFCPTALCVQLHHYFRKSAGLFSRTKTGHGKLSTGTALSAPKTSPILP